jgi:cytidine deaminase
MSDDELVNAAQEARKRAYAPYSNYSVGCALQTQSGEMFTGANVENASYGLCVCAERSAVVAAVNAGHREIAAVAVATQNDPPAAPCGMCRQTLNEFTSNPEQLRVILVSPSGSRKTTTLAELFPFGFRGQELEK